MASPVASKVSVTLDLPPSCIQFCPAHPNYFVVGTYNLEKDENENEEGLPSEADADAQASVKKRSQSRNGSLVVFRVEGSELTKVQTVSQPSALLDLRFYKAASEYQDILAVVSSTGTLAIFQLNPNRDASSPLQHLATSRCDDLAEDVLFLQCDWQPVIRHTIAVTTSTGLARLLLLDGEWKIKESTDLGIPNSLEAWCIAFSPASPITEQGQLHTTTYCGGDDSVLRYTSCCWDTTDKSSPLQEPFGAVTMMGQHEAGVTAILPLSVFAKNGGRVVLTGSYDDHMRVLTVHDLQDSYGMKRVQVAADENLGGGVWRLNLIDVQSSGMTSKIRVLASCMHAGTRLVQVETEDGEEWTCQVLRRFEEHKSMNYGGDVLREGGAGGALTCVSTSFYDKLLCLWEVEGELGSEDENK